MLCFRVENHERHEHGVPDQPLCGIVAPCMRWQLGWQGAVAAIVSFGVGLVLGGNHRTTEPIQSTVSERLRPVDTVSSESAATGTIYVPVYSTLFLGVPNQSLTVNLSATVSVRNVSAVHEITLDWVRYYDSFGKHLRDYLTQPSALPTLGSVEFVVQRSDTTGGAGANFLIRWHATAAVDEPLAEAIMLGQSGNAGISFSSRGRTLTAAAER